MGDSLHIHRLDSIKHRDFLAQQRRDPLTHELLQPGHEIIICANDGIAFLADCWQDACPLCKRAETLAEIPRHISHIRLGGRPIMDENVNQSAGIEEIPEFIMSFLSYLVRIISIIIIILIIYKDYYQKGTSFIMDIGSAFIGLIIIAIISSSIKSNISHTIQAKISNGFPNIFVFILGMIFCALSVWGWEYFLPLYNNRYFHQMVIIGLFTIPFASIRIYHITRKTKRYIAIPCKALFLGFALGTSFYFIFKDKNDLILSLIKEVQSILKYVSA